MGMFDEDGQRFLNAGVMSAEPRGRKRAEGVWLPGQHGAVVVGAEPEQRTLGWTREDSGDPEALRERRQRQAIMQRLEQQRSMPKGRLLDRPQAPAVEMDAMAKGGAGANAAEKLLGRVTGARGAAAERAFPGPKEGGGGGEAAGRCAGHAARGGRAGSPADGGDHGLRWGGGAKQAARHHGRK